MRRLIRGLGGVVVALLTATGMVAGAAPTARAVGPTSITIVASDPQSSGWSLRDGVITPDPGTNAVIKAAEVAAALSSDLEIRADTITISAPISWSGDTQLHLNSSGPLYVGANLSASGASAGLQLTSSPVYDLDVASGAHLELTGTAPKLNVNRTAFTVVNTLAQLANITDASGNVALGRSLSLTAEYRDAVITGAFAATFDGLGNEISGLKIRSSGAGGDGRALGLFAETRGATIRNLGVTNVDIQTSAKDLATHLRVGAVVGNSGDAALATGWSASAYTTTMTSVWSSGSIRTADTAPAVNGADTDTQGSFFAGGLVGSNNNGTLDISRSWSTASVSAAGSYSGNLAVGGLVGDSSGMPVSKTSGGGQALKVSVSYAAGSIVQGRYGAGGANYYGGGGIVGVKYGASGQLDSVFSWSSVVGTASVGGLYGYWSGAGTVTTSYHTAASVGNGMACQGTCLNAMPGSPPGLPNGFSSDYWEWDALDRLVLKLARAPKTTLFVKVADVTGAYADLSYAVVDAGGKPVDFTGPDLSGLTGTAAYTIAADTPAGTYDVSYLWGLNLAGNKADGYQLAPWNTPGKVTIKGDTTKPTLSGGNTSPTVPAGETAVTSFTADEDVTWSLGNTDQALFELTGGVLTFKNPATPGTYTVDVIATDGDGNTTTITITVTVPEAEPPAPSSRAARVYFVGGKATLTTAGKKQLRKLWAGAEGTQITAVKVTGGVNTAKWSTYTRKLAKARAAVVVKYLRKLGLEVSATTATAKGTKGPKSRKATVTLTYTYAK